MLILIYLHIAYKKRMLFLQFNKSKLSIKLHIEEEDY